MHDSECHGMAALDGNDTWGEDSLCKTGLYRQQSTVRTEMRYVWGEENTQKKKKRVLLKINSMKSLESILVVEQFCQFYISFMTAKYLVERVFKLRSRI